MKRSSQIKQKKYFRGDDVIDDVTEWPQSRLSIFLCEWKIAFFVITEEWTKILSSNLVYICIIELWIHHSNYRGLLCWWRRRSENKSKLWTAIALSIFKIALWSKAQNVTYAHGYLYSIFKFLYIPLWIENQLFPDNWKTSKDIKLDVHMCHWIVCLYIHLNGSHQLWRHQIPKQVRISNCNNSVNIFTRTSTKAQNIGNIVMAC